MDEYASLMLSAMVQQMNVNQYYRYGSNIPEQYTTIQKNNKYSINYKMYTEKLPTKYAVMVTGKS